MQIRKEKRITYTAVYQNGQGVIDAYKRPNGKAVQYKSKAAIDKFLKEQKEPVKGYYSTEIIQRAVLEGLPKGHTYKLEDAN